MNKIKTMDGNEACAHIAYMFTELAGIYPITPSSPMAEYISKWSCEGRKNLFNTTVKVVQMQSEAGVAGMMHGSLQTGCLTSTFTASQGLLLMIPNMYKMAGELLPAVFHVASRSLSTHALSIMGDHQDIYATRATGFAIFANSSVQQIMDLSAVTHLSSIQGRIPFINFFDGFRTSHELNKIEILDQNDLKPLMDDNKILEFKENALSTSNKVIRGTNQGDDIYFQATEVRNRYYNELPDTVNHFMEIISKITNRTYKPFNYYGDNKAKRIIVAMGSVCETIKETIDELNKNDEKVGLIEVHLYRPFSSKYFFNVLPKTVEKIAVLDRTKEAGSNGEPLYLDVLSLFSDKEYKPLIIGGRYGLSSKDTTPNQIAAVYEFLDNSKNFSGFTIGIDDDVTNLSLKEKNIEILNNNLEIKIYGYGSDGMVTCSKNIAKIIGDNSANYVQSYSQYDSKKSGGLTISHLRISKKPIRSTYYIKNPFIVVCSKDSYLEKYDMVSSIKENGIFIYVTSLNENDLLNKIPGDIKRILNKKNIKMYTINAYDIAKKYNLGNKISMILQRTILKFINFSNDKEINKMMIEEINNKFINKGKEVINNNIKAIEEAISNIKEIKLDDKYNNFKNIENFNNKIYNMMNNLKGNELKVSDFMDYSDGSFIPNTASYEKRGIAEEVPVWNSSKCISCNMCSFVCPHGVIRPSLLNEKEVSNAPLLIKNNLKDYNDKYKYYLGISDFDCTGCGLCASICPSKALEMKPFDHDDHEFCYIKTSVNDKDEEIKNTIKNSQFKTPLFNFSGACPGCGQTPYLKLLTQLFGDELIIANATGCSSIYASSMPSTAYNIPWASSLFEDNAEYGYGMIVANNEMRNKIKNLMNESINVVDLETKNLFKEWLENEFDFNITKKVKENLNYKKVPYLNSLKNYIPTRSVWMIGGDGWAFDIGFSGIDHVLSSNEDVNILVLNTEVYSNTGGQTSKASEKGSISKFSENGKVNSKKDLAKIAMSYENVYVAQISMGANMKQTIDAFVEAKNHKGPSIIIAYSPCIEHGIKGGLKNSSEEEKMAVESGYFPIFRYNPNSKVFNLDSTKTDFNKFDDFLKNELRFSNQTNKDLLKETKENAINRYKYYENLAKK